ncbi:unnamed protein product [Gemmata massiliana]|uniref:Uncharacterized protein n=1 Tax=Gemmata massiliana TaxID=1210884 RepID=A0A6P2D0V2_9BACT|nr:hypothetical protein [Gemmata massiliana]VTR94759.1 unnamed protein product [Gemmata massiliana]
MTIRVALATITISTALFACIGGGLGWAVGAYHPGYYRAMFRTGQEPWFDPVSIGVGQGVGQGVAGGATVGLIVVALFVWRDVRMRRLAIEAGEPDPATTTW